MFHPFNARTPSTNWFERSLSRSGALDGRERAGSELHRRGTLCGASDGDDSSDNDDGPAGGKRGARAGTSSPQWPCHRRPGLEPIPARIYTLSKLVEGPLPQSGHIAAEERFVMLKEVHPSTGIAHWRRHRLEPLPERRRAANPRCTFGLPRMHSPDRGSDDRGGARVKNPPPVACAADDSAPSPHQQQQPCAGGSPFPLRRQGRKHAPPRAHGSSSGLGDTHQRNSQGSPSPAPRGAPKEDPFSSKTRTPAASSPTFIALALTRPRQFGRKSLLRDDLEELERMPLLAGKHRAGDGGDALNASWSSSSSVSPRRCDAEQKQRQKRATLWRQRQQHRSGGSGDEASDKQSSSDRDSFLEDSNGGKLKHIGRGRVRGSNARGDRRKNRGECYTNRRCGECRAVAEMVEEFECIQRSRLEREKRQLEMQDLF